MAHHYCTCDCLQWDKGGLCIGVTVTFLCGERSEERKGVRQTEKKTKRGGVWCVWCERSEALQCCLISSSCFISFSLAGTWCHKLKQIFKCGLWQKHMHTRHTHTHTKTHSEKLPHLSPFPSSRLCRYVRFRLSSFSSFAFFQAELRLLVFSSSAHLKHSVSIDLRDWAFTSSLLKFGSCFKVFQSSALAALALLLW